MGQGRYFFRKVPCPVCGSGPLIFVSCRSCGAILAWCGEEDHAVGRYRGKDLLSLGSGETRDWAKKGCPKCGSEEIRYSEGGEVAALGFVSAEVMGSAGSGEGLIANPEL